MKTKLLAVSAVGAALVLSACSTTTPNPGPTPPPPNGNGLLIPSGGQTQQVNAYVSGNENEGVVAIAGGQTYRFSGGQYEGNAYGIDAYSYSSGNISDPNGAAIFAGSHVGAAVVADNSTNPNRGIFVVGGNETEVMPNQTATYEGLWTLVNNGGGGTEGVFAADADFDNRRIVFGLSDGDDINNNFGSGSGSISGNGFNSSFNTNAASGMASNNTASGNFYGPNAEEIGGLISGQASRTPTAGMLIGSQR